MLTIAIPVPTKEAVAYILSELFAGACKIAEPEVFWYTMVDEKPSQVLSILSHYGRKHPDRQADLDELQKAVRAVTEDEAGAVAQAALL